MTQKTKAPQDETQAGSPLARQVIVSAIALGIIGLGGWSMWSQSAPYHPEFDPEYVTRSPVPALSQTIASN